MILICQKIVVLKYGLVLCVNAGCLSDSVASRLFGHMAFSVCQTKVLLPRRLGGTQEKGPPVLHSIWFIASESRVPGRLLLWIPFPSQAFWTESCPWFLSQPSSSYASEALCLFFFPAVLFWYCATDNNFPGRVW